AATVDGVAITQQPTVAVGPAVASNVNFVVQPPASTTAGATLTPAVQVEIRDQFNNRVTNATNGVTLAIGTNPSAGTLTGGTPAVAAVNGVATFSGLSIDKAGTGYTLVASSTGLTNQTSSAFNITAGTATQLVFSVQPTNTVAGAAITPAIQVTAQDGSGNTATGFTGNITLAIGTNSGSGTLAGTLSHAAVGGVATFSGLSIGKVGTGYTLTASATGPATGTSTAFNVTAGSAATLVFTVQPTSTVAGGSITPAVEVTARDANGNTATGFTGNVTLAIGTNAGGGTLSGATHAAVGGVATFAGRPIDQGGTGYTLTAKGPGPAAGTRTTFNITAGTAATRVFTVQPTSTVAGAGITPAIEVTARDANGNTATGFTGNVTLAIGTNPSGGALSGTATHAASGGVATFAGLSIDKVGTGYTLTASSGGLTGASAGFNITRSGERTPEFQAPGPSTGGGVSSKHAIQ